MATAEIRDKANVHELSINGSRPTIQETQIKEHHANSGAKVVVAAAGSYRLTDTSGAYLFSRAITGTPISGETAPTAGPGSDSRWFDMSAYNKAQFHVKFTTDTAATCSITTYYWEPDGTISHSATLTNVSHMLKCGEDFVGKKHVLFLITSPAGTATRADIIAGGI